MTKKEQAEQADEYIGKLRAVLLEILDEYDDHESISPTTWQKACNLIGRPY